MPELPEITLESQAGVLFRNRRRRIEQRLRQQNAFLVSLHKMTLQLMSRLERDEVLAHILTQAAQLIETAHGFLYLVDPETDCIEIKVAIGIMANRLGVRLHRGEGLAGRVWASGRPMAIADYHEWEGRLAQFAEERFHSIVAVPLQSATTFMGVIGLVRLEAGRPFSQHEIKWLGRFAQLAAIALDNATLYQQAQQELAQRREAEAQLRRTSSELQAVLDAFPDLLFRLDAAGVFLDYKSGAPADLLAPPAAFLGKPMGEVLPPELAQQFEAAIAQVLQSRELVTTEYSLTLPVGEQFFEARMVPFLDEQVIVKIRNITARRRAEKRSMAFASLAQLLNPITTPEEAAEVIVAVADQLIGWDACWLAVLTPDNTFSQTVINMDLINGQRQSMAAADPGVTPISPITRRVLAEGKLLIQNPAGADPAAGFVPFGDTARASASLMFVPIRNGSKVTGILSIQSYTPNAYNEADLETLQALADHAGGALDRIRVESEQQQMLEAQRETAARQFALYEVLRIASGQFESAKAARLMRNAIQQLSGWSGVSIILVSDDGHDWEVVAPFSELPPADRPLRFPVSQGVIGRAIASGQVQYVPEVSHDPDFMPSRRLHTHSEMVAPLRLGERILGVLNVESDEADAFNRDDIALAESLAGTVALALENARLYNQTAQQHSRLAAIIESSRDGIIMVNLEQQIQVANKAALKLLGMSGLPADWLKRPLREALASLGHQHAAAELCRIWEGEEPAGSGELELPPSIIRWACLPVTGLQGRLLILRDVTEERLASRMRDDLTQTMVHDLRNPLAAIAGAAELLITDWQEMTAAEQQQMLGVVRQNAHRLLDLITTILDIARLESRQMPLHEAYLDVAALVADTLQLQAPLALEKQLQLVNQVERSLPFVWADDNVIGRVLQNLVGNAIKFTPPGGVIQVTAWQVNPGYLQVTVADSGPGIPLNIQGQLFQKFITGRQTGRGSGLGLAFCRLAVEAHGGRIWAESDPAQGARFHFTLPIRDKLAEN